MCEASEERGMIIEYKQGVILISGDAYSNESGGNSNNTWNAERDSGIVGIDNNNAYNDDNNAPRPDFYKTKVYELIWS